MSSSEILATTGMVPAVVTAYPHNYSGETKRMTIVKHFWFTHADQVREQFPMGTYEMPVEVANHWYAQHHSDTPPESLPQPGTPQFAEVKRLEMQKYSELRNQQLQQEMLQNAAINRKALEESVRLEVTDRLRAEIAAEYERKTAEAVAAAVAATVGESNSTGTDAVKSKSK